MSAELETAAAESAAHLVRARGHAPEPGALCANCGAVLQGPYCHACGQNSDTHKRSILHLIWEAIEGLFHLDGRLLRTLPALFLRPGALAKDYMEGRIVRHVPPFRTFLVALLLFIFAAEHALHELTLAQEHQAELRAQALATPQGRAAEATRRRTEAAEARDEALKDAAKDRAEDLKDADLTPAKVEAAYGKAVQTAQAHYDQAIAKADKIATTSPGSLEDAKSEVIKALSEPETAKPVGKHGSDKAWLKDGLRKAVANPEYYLTVMFAWGHRLAVLLLPIVGLSLALVYVYKRKYFIYDHLLVAMNLLSFVFLTNALVLVLPPPYQLYALAFVAIWTPVNLFQTLRGAYGSSILGATLKTAIVWFSTVFAFTLLLTGLMIFTLGQL